MHTLRLYFAVLTLLLFPLGLSAQKVVNPRPFTIPAIYFSVATMALSKKRSVFLHVMLRGNR